MQPLIMILFLTHVLVGTDVDIEIVYNNTSKNRLLSLGPPVLRQSVGLISKR
jgi:hypothetical protein